MELFHFPFQVEIWGTVSDWALIFITGITLFYIYKTFKSQLLVQKSQIDLLQIEIDRFLEDSQPFFHIYEFAFYDFKKEKDSPNLVYNLKQMGKIELINFKIISDKNFEFELISEYPDKVRQQSEITIMFFIKNEQIGNFNFTAFLFYEDRYRNKYRQALHAFENLDNNIEASISAISKNDRVTDIFHDLKVNK